MKASSWNTSGKMEERYDLAFSGFLPTPFSIFANQQTASTARLPALSLMARSCPSPSLPLLPQFAYTIGRACPTCLRGAIATRDIKANEVLLSIPIKLGIPLPRLGWHGFAGEYASELIRLFKLDADYAARHQLHWSTQPPPGDMLTPELFTDAQLEALQTPRLAELLRYQRSVCEETYRGNLSWATFDPISEMLKDVGGMTLDEFKHWASIVGTRDFGLTHAAHAHADPRDAHSMSTMKVLNPEVKAEELPKTAMFLLPVADMVNHQDNANAERYDNGSHIMMKAKVDIKAGEAVTNNYQPNVLHRNDMSLYIYGFVQSENDLNVLSIDLPTWNRERAFDATNPDDSTFYGPQGQFNTPAELERLTTLLDGMPTTQEEDEALLARGGFASWQDETIVRFRLGRKKALTNAIRLIKEALRNAGIEEHEGKAWHDDL
jgi:hypothetical protein